MLAVDRDIYLEVSVRPHPVFARDGDDLVAILEVPVADAALGSPPKLRHSMALAKWR